jgi:hypothetical protein
MFLFVFLVCMATAISSMGIYILIQAVIEDQKIKESKPFNPPQELLHPNTLEMIFENAQPQWINDLNDQPQQIDPQNPIPNHEAAVPFKIILNDQDDTMDVAKAFLLDQYHKYQSKNQ